MVLLHLLLLNRRCWVATLLKIIGRWFDWWSILSLFSLKFVHRLDLLNLLISRQKFYWRELVWFSSWNKGVRLIYFTEVPIEDFSQILHFWELLWTLLGCKIWHLLKWAVHFNLKLTWIGHNLVLHTLSNLFDGSSENGERLDFRVLQKERNYMHALFETLSRLCQQGLVSLWNRCRDFLSWSRTLRILLWLSFLGSTFLFRWCFCLRLLLGCWSRLLLHRCSFWLFVNLVIVNWLEFLILGFSARIGSRVLTWRLLDICGTTLLVLIF